MTVPNVDLIMSSMPRVIFVFKYVVMQRDTLQTVMMETMLMEMDAAETAILKLDTHVTVDLQTQLTPVAQPCPQSFLSKKEDNPIFMEKLY